MNDEIDMNKQLGIRERIVAAKTVEEANALLDEARHYDFISARTMAACGRAYRQKLESLKEGK